MVSSEADSVTNAAFLKFLHGIKGIEHSPAIFAERDWLSKTRRFSALDGVCGADLPYRVGGLQFSATLMAELFIACGHISADYRDVPGAGHARFLLGAQTRNYDPILRRVAAGEAFVSIAITEEMAGSDMLGLKTIALPKDGEYLLTGKKMFVSRLQEATHIIAFAQVPRGKQQLLSAFLIESSTPGLRFTDLSPVGLKGVSFGGVEFENVRLPRSARIGGEGQAFLLFTKHFTYWRTAMACVALGSARCALDQAAERLRTRQAFGAPIGRFTHLQQEFVRHASLIHWSYLFLRDVMQRIEAKEPAFVDAQLAKAEVTEVALSSVDFAMRVHGALGVTTQLDLEERLRDLLCLRIADGTTDLLRTQAARSILGDVLYEHSIGRSNQYRPEHPILTRKLW